MTVQFRLRELIEDDKGNALISQTELARMAGVSFATVNRICTNATEQVSLKTLGSLSSALTRVLGKVVEPGELIERVPERRTKRK